MLKERKLLRKENIFLNELNEIVYEGGKDIVGWFTYDSYLGDLKVSIQDDKNKVNINHEDYYFTEFESTATESDYHTFVDTYNFKGVYLAFNLNIIDTLKYFNKDLKNELFDEKDLIKEVEKILSTHNMIRKYDNHETIITDREYLQVVLLDKKLDDKVLNCAKDILKCIREYYNKNGVHITRMFGSYILLKNIKGELKAIKATPIPIKYCPLMIKLLKEVGGDLADKLIESLNVEDEKTQTEMMCELINEVVIKGGYFDTNRPLNSCEANVLFGASETMSSAFKTGLIDAAVIVSNNLGTIITTNEFNTQGAVKRMTGLFYTSPDEKIVNTALNSGIIPVFPYTASIDQLEGVKKAIALGYKKIAVSVAAYDNYLHEELSKLEKENNITIYKFGLCSTGINKETAEKMKAYADVIWSCASKYVKELIEPSALAQVGIKIPVHIMTKQGWEIIKNHLLQMNNQHNLNIISLQEGEEKPVILNSETGIKVIKKKQLKHCSDCPRPCI